MHGEILGNVLRRCGDRWILTTCARRLSPIVSQAPVLHQMLTFGAVWMQIRPNLCFARENFRFGSHWRRRSGSRQEPFGCGTAGGSSGTPKGLATLMARSVGSELKRGRAESESQRCRQGAQRLRAQRKPIQAMAMSRGLECTWSARATDATSRAATAARMSPPVRLRWPRPGWPQ
jgi:hypothetical protein